MMIVDIKVFVYKKDANFLISALKSSEKGGRGNISII